MSILGVILAGGKSTRMKQDKALLTLEGVSLLERQFQKLERHLGRGNVVVSGDRPGFPHVRDVDSGLGPLEGLRSVCLHSVNKNSLNPLLVVPVDMPFMTDAGLIRLIDFNGKKIVTKFYGQQLPMIINNPSAVLKAIEEMRVSSGSAGESTFSLRNLFQKIEVEEIPAEPTGFFANINTPEDWYAALL